MYGAHPAAATPNIERLTECYFYDSRADTTQQEPVSVQIETPSTIQSLKPLCACLTTSLRNKCDNLVWQLFASGSFKAIAPLALTAEIKQYLIAAGQTHLFTKELVGFVIEYVRCDAPQLPHGSDGGVQVGSQIMAIKQTEKIAVLQEFELYRVEAFRPIGILTDRRFSKPSWRLKVCLDGKPELKCTSRTSTEKSEEIPKCAFWKMPPASRSSSTPQEHALLVAKLIREAK